MIVRMYYKHTLHTAYSTLHLASSIETVYPVGSGWVKYLFTLVVVM